MKKLSSFLFLIMVVFSGALLSACGESIPEIKLSTTNVVIYLGETENNTEVVNAKLVDLNANQLGVSYDPTDITVTPSEKLSDGSFDLYITPNGERGCKNVEVTVNAGSKVEAMFTVTVVVPVTNIIPNENIFVPFVDGGVRFNLLNEITFKPDLTEQTAVVFTMVDNAQARIEGSELVLDAGFNTFYEPLNITVQSVEDGKSGLVADFEVIVVPNVRYLANQITMKCDLGGGLIDIPTENEVNITITDGELSTFEVYITIPKTLGIDVNVDDLINAENNIMQYLNYEKWEYDSPTVADATEVKFKFGTKNLRSGLGNLCFKFAYTNANLKDKDNLMSSFVVCGGKAKDYALVKIEVPVQGLNIKANDVMQNGLGEYIIYNSYNIDSNIYGSEFVISTNPINATEKRIIVSALEGVEIVAWDGVEQKFVNLYEGDTFVSGASLYIKGQDGKTAGHIDLDSVETGVITPVRINFAIRGGATGLGFVNEAGGYPFEQLDVAVECGNVDGTLILLWAPGVVSENDLIYNQDLLEIYSSPVVGQEDYMIVKVTSDNIGEFTTEILTANGYRVVLNVNCIQTISYANITTGNKEQEIAGIGRYEMENGSIKNMSVKHGYSLPLQFEYDEGAEINSIKYSFVDAVLGDDPYIDEWAEEYVQFAPDVNGVFDEYSLIVNSQNLFDDKLLTATKEGKTLIKIEVIGFVVNEFGAIVSSPNPITKFICVEVYRPDKDIFATAKTVELRAQNELSEDDYNQSFEEIDVNVLANGGHGATYDGIYIDDGVGSFNPELDAFIIKKEYSNEGLEYSAVLNTKTKVLTLTLISIPNNYNSAMQGSLRQTITLFAADFYNGGIQNGADKVFYSLNSVKSSYSTITYSVFIDVIKTEHVLDINVKSLKCESIEESEVGGAISVVKTYESMYFNTTKITNGTSIGRILTEVLPLNAFNKDLVYKFVPTQNSSSGLLDVSSNDGFIYFNGSVGGTGYIEIVPADEHAQNIKVIIPIVMADGNSKLTAFEISNLADIGNPNKHYKIITNSTLELSETIFDGEVFKGGLYGEGNATIKLNGCALFTSIGAGAEVSGLTLYGDVLNANGFVANQNNGTIKNINVTTYMLDKIYVPSLLTPIKDAEFVGGIVGENFAILENCSFSGSVRRNGTNANIGGIAGNIDVNFMVANSLTIVESKFERTIQTNGRVIGYNGNFINGIVNENSNNDGQPFVGNKITFEDAGNALDGNEYIKTNLRHSIGEELNENGIVFFYGAKDETKQALLNAHNIIPLSNLIESSCSKIKATALGANNSNCTIAKVSGDNLVLTGVGAFKLRIYSVFDYTNYVDLNLVSLYYFEEFGLFVDGQKMANGETLQILKDARETFISNTIVGEYGLEVELKQNIFDVKFLLGVDDASNFVTGSSLGRHTINASWPDYENKTLKVSLVSGYGVAFDALLNKTFCDENNYVLNIEIKNGTTRIETTTNSGTIEPKDAITITALLSTDIETDKISENLKILNNHGYDCMQDGAFKVEVSETPVEVNGKYAYTITISLIEEFRHKADYVNQTYKIYIYAENNAGVLYDVYTMFTLTIAPQSLSNINVTLFDIASKNAGQAFVNKTETPTSLISPTQSAIMFVDLYPSFATFDYIEISATSSTLARLAYRVQKKDVANGGYSYDDNAIYEALTDANGIRIYNSFGNNAMEQDIGSYYILLFATNTLNEDAVFNIEINAFYKGVKLSKSTTFTLYVKMPEVPNISISGKTSVYAYPGEVLSANLYIAKEQTLSSAVIKNANNEELEDVIVRIESIPSQKAGYSQYKLEFMIPHDLEINQINNHLRLIVKAVRVNNGETIDLPSELQIYIVDFKAEQNSITINNVIDGVFNVSSVRYDSLTINSNLLAYYEEGKNNAVELFNKNYYFANNNGFDFGTKMDNVSSARVLSTYLYYVNDNQASPVAVVDNNGEVTFVHNGQYGDIINFNIKDAEYDNRGNIVVPEILQVKGGRTTGEVPMLLQIYYTMPDGATYVYEYNFTIVNMLYTTEDMPIEIENASAFVNIPKAETAQDYILNGDLYLYEYSPMLETSKIKSLDGNNYSINIMSFEKPEQTNVNYALFQTVSSGTTIKNLTVNYYYLSEIYLPEEVTSVAFAGFAINNNGVITNCEVISYKEEEKVPTHSVFGLKLTQNEKANSNINVAGFVVNNTGSVTHSRVGGDSKLNTYFDYQDPENPILKESELQATTFTIRAPGTISGFCYSNTGVIASSFAKNINIINTYNKNTTVITAGFVNSNEGTISMSYVEGNKKSTEIQSVTGGIESSGIMAGFVYSNIGTISDAYSNIMLHTSNNQVGRLGAGFVYYNAPTAKIEASYSFSAISGENTTQFNFAGITDLMQYNNLGVIKNCYYFISEEKDSVSIEQMYNTEITSITNVNDYLYFYGFSFAKEGVASTNATWQSTETGPRLVSADDIAHSVRFKLSNPAKGNSSLEYRFVYAEKYDLGTTNNPIIIRTAQEFNGVFGGYKATTNYDVVKDNINATSKKVYGTYRLVNNINLNELIISDKEDTDYKYTLASTQMTLTGEQKASNQRAGSFNGNGLTIYNLAISNGEIKGEQNYGMFKSIENGASFSNVNIVLSTGGVKADNTVCVGTIAGTLSDSSLINVKVSTSGQESHTDIIGANIVGGAVGRVIKDSYVFGVTVSNVSVVATYYGNEGFASADYRNNIYNRNATKHTANSIAGGVFGVVDIYTQAEELSNQTRDNDDIRFSNVQKIEANGSMTISGMTVGGVMGYAGKFVVAKDLAFVISNTRETKLIAYKCFAGGVVGFNAGYLYQVRAEHEKAWQNQIETNVSKYYSENTDNSLNMGNMGLFQSTNEITYRPQVIGGLVGVMDNGVINIGYSKLNVRNEYAEYAGGVIGFVNASINDLSPSDMTIVQLSQVYATGDVYSNKYVGGIIGYNRKTTIALDKISALNVWSKETIETFSGNSEYMSQIARFSDDAKSASIIDIAVLESVKFTEGQTQIAKIRTSEGEFVFDSQPTTVKPYYYFKGVAVDSGAQIDVAFSDTGWYETGNWSRDAVEVYPHIVYTIPTTVYDIYDVGDFWKFGAYGSNPEARFVVRKDGLIDCSKGSQITYPIIKGSIVGLYEGSGFMNMNTPLFKKAINAKISNLKFDACKAPIVEVTEGTTRYSFLSYSNCNFTKAQSKQASEFSAKKYNYAGITYQVKSQNVSFNNISFNECSLGVGSKYDNINTGLLFAETLLGSYAEPQIRLESIFIGNAENAINTSVNSVVGRESNIGLVFGMSAVKTTIENIGLSVSSANANAISLSVGADFSLSGEDGTAKTTHIGLIGGYADDILIKNCTSNIGLKITGKFINDDEKAKNQKLAVGGLIGKASKFTINNTNEVIDKDETGFAKNYVDVCGNQGVAYVGGLVGHVGTMDYNLVNNIIVGGDVDSYSYIRVEASSESTHVGGIVGYVDADLVAQTSSAYLMYKGDIIISQKEGSGNIFAGGVIGTLNANSGSVPNLVFGGAISFENSKENNATYYIGGLIGNTTGGTAEFKDVYSFGDIILEGKTFKLNTSANAYVGGLIGQNQGTQITATTQVVCLTTIARTYNPNANLFLDAIANIDEGTITGANMHYATNVNICTSDLEHATNETYADAKELINQNIKDSFIREVASKLNPLSLDNLDEKVENVYEVTQEASATGVITKTIKGLKERRKVFVFIPTAQDGEEQLELDYQLNLENTFVFGDGASVYTELTPFNSVNELSVVSGIIAKVKIDNKTNSFAGFVNENKGIIFTCGARETLVHFEDINIVATKTQFYGLLKSELNNNNQTLGGFVKSNRGYIFGSDSNMNIQVQSQGTVVGGFAGDNQGFIEYSYANGFVNLEQGANVMQMDLFAINTGAGKIENSYTIFANQVGEIAKLTLPEAGCYYEQDACETVISGNKGAMLYGMKDEKLSRVGTQEFPESFKKFFSTAEGFNSNYPTISNGPSFQNLTYLKRNTNVYRNLVNENNSGYINQGYYFDDVKLGEEVIYSQVPNITVLRNIKERATTNHVFTRSMNLGYKKEIYKENIIDEIENVVIDGYYKSIMNLTLQNANFIGVVKSSTYNIDQNPTTIRGIKFENLILKNSSGVIGENHGLIVDCEISGLVVVSFTQEGQEIIKDKNANNETVDVKYAVSGALVGTNAGLVNNCYTTATYVDGYMVDSTNHSGIYQMSSFAPDSVIEGSNKNYVFGGIVGKNTCLVQDSGLTKANMFIVVGLSENVNIKIGGVVGTMVQQGGTATKVDKNYVNESYLMAASRGNTTMGGVVGLVVKNGFADCVVTETYTDTDSTIVAGLESGTDKFDILEKDSIFNSETEEHGIVTEQTNAGGIVGSMVNLSASGMPRISDCTNYADVASRAKWQQMTTYAGNSGWTVRQTQYIKDMNSVVVYERMESKAYAGGIVSDYLKSDNVETQGVASGVAKSTRLANYGNVYGGYMGWKPTSIINVEGRGTYSTSVSTLVSAALFQTGVFFAAKIMMNHAAKFAARKLATLTFKMALASNPIGWFVLAVSEVWSLWNAYKDYQNELKTLGSVTLDVSLINGNGDYVPNIDDSKSGYIPEKDELRVLNEDVAKAINEAVKKDSVGKKNMEMFTGASIENITIGEHNGKYWPQYKITGSKDYTVFDNAGETRYFYYEDYIRRDVPGIYSELLFKSLGRIYYDGIAASFADDPTTKNLNIFNNVPNYIECNNNTQDDPSDDFIALKTVDGMDRNNLSGNSLLQFRLCQDAGCQNAGACQYEANLKDVVFYNQVANPNNSSWNNTDAWEEGELKVSTPDPLQYKEDEDGNFVFEIKDPKYWKNLVYTLNEGVTIIYDAGGKILGEDRDVNKYKNQNVIVNINIDDTIEDKSINVGNYTIKDFNGTINVQSANTYFKGLDIKLGETTKPFGIIESSTYAKLNNVDYKGKLNIRIQRGVENKVAISDFGLLIGNINAGGQVQINGSNIDIEKVTIQDYSLSGVKSFGGIVGVNGGSVEIINSTVKLNAKLEDVAVKQSQREPHALGGIIAVNSAGANAKIMSTTVSGKVVTIGEINNVGGFVGYNAGEITTSAIKLQTSQLSTVSYYEARTGGIVGYNNNSGIIQMASKTEIGNSGALISADVRDYFTNNIDAYAGGLVGRNDGEVKLTLGSEAIIGSSSGAYNSEVRILAGYNAYSEFEPNYIIPVNAKAGLIIGVCPGSLENNGTISKQNVLVRSKMAPLSINPNGASASVNPTYLNADVTEITNRGFNVEGNKISYINTITKNESGVEYKHSINNFISHEVKRYSYTNESTDSIVNEFYLTYNLSINNCIYQDGEGLEKIEDETVLKYLIRISKNNAKYNDKNNYLLEIILLNYAEFASANEGIKGTDLTTPKVVYACRFNSSSANNIYFGELSSLNLMSLSNEIVTHKKLVSGNATVGTMRESAINSTTTKVVIENGNLKFVETLTLTDTLTEYDSSDESKPKLNSSVSYYNLDRTLFECVLDENITKDTSGSAEWEDDKVLIDANTTHIIEKEHADGTIETLVSNSIFGSSYTFIDDDTMREYEISYKQGKIEYNGQEVKEINVYQKNINGKDYVIVSLVSEAGSDYIVNEFIYLKNDVSKFAYKGKIIYTLNQTAYETEALRTHRYEAFFPIVDMEITGVNYGVTILEEDIMLNSQLGDFKNIIKIDGITITKNHLTFTIMADGTYSEAWSSEIKNFILNDSLEFAGEIV